MRILDILTDHFRIPLPGVLSDSTHGQIADFALITVRVLCDTGEEGLGYTYTVGSAGGAAIHTSIERDLRPVLLRAGSRRTWGRLRLNGRQRNLAVAVQQECSLRYG